MNGICKIVSFANSPFRAVVISFQPLNQFGNFCPAHVIIISKTLMWLSCPSSEARCARPQQIFVFLTWNSSCTGRTVNRVITFLCASRLSLPQSHAFRPQTWRFGDCKRKMVHFILYQGPEVATHPERRSWLQQDSAFCWDPESKMC